MRQLLSTIVITILITGILAINYVQTALADNITCGDAENCQGTQGSDTIIGDDDRNIILGCGGDDVIVGNNGDDDIRGDDENTRECQIANGNESGEPGADKIEGGDGDDRISHANNGIVTPDGHKDIIDCGAGNDSVWINEAIDKDVAKNCEVVNADIT